MIYQFGQGTSGYKNLNPQSVGETLEQLRVAHGGQLTPVHVVDAARDKASALHGGFTWDDTLAAHLHRVDEARYLMRHITVVVKEGEEPVKAFWSIRVAQEDDSIDSPSDYYQAAQALKSRPEEYASALKRVLMEIEGAEISLQQLKRIAPDKDRSKIDKAAAHVLDAHDTLYQPSAMQ